MDFENEILSLIKTGKLDLISTHKHLSIPVIKRIYKKMKLKLIFDSIQVDNENVIINGHHRYIASKLADFNLDVSTRATPSLLSLIFY
ncbi:hypothetical protein [Algoriphagus sp.]|uniref:hypothetical protein n=1 Tax=Algoriphagus sp. TaxID=1872435 RepID=UPI00261D8D24|nr:hypothetical protein [Algoriphagus sp.]